MKKQIYGFFIGKLQGRNMLSQHSRVEPPFRSQADLWDSKYIVTINSNFVIKYEVMASCTTKCRKLKKGKSD